jgi:hypothetical protein
MSSKNLRNSLTRLQNTLSKPEAIPRKGVPTISKKESIIKSIKSIEENIWDATNTIEDKKAKIELLNNLNNLKNAKTTSELLKTSIEMLSLLEKTNATSQFKFNFAKVPLTIKGEIIADLEEMTKCFKHECYRSAIIICGRMLEVVLHRKYYDITNKDILETAPGIGLGKLIAKLVEKEVDFDPGVTQQIHLINNIRISSVHKKKKVFKPTKAQTHATILFTLDIIEKLF